jgi:hypothetical protein
MAVKALRRKYVPDNYPTKMSLLPWSKSSQEWQEKE